MPNISSGIGVGFKVGSLNSINTMITSGINAGATPGCFYLAEDTHRLYIGNDNGSISSVNEGVITVAGISNLPTLSATASENAPYQGLFYYVSGENILCVCSGNTWVLINPDTHLLPKTTNTSVTSTTSNNITTVKITNTVQDTSRKDNGGNWIPANTSSGDFSLVGSENVLISVSGRTITFSSPNGATYDLTAATVSSTNPQSVKLTLTGSNGDSDEIVFLKGDKGVYPELQQDGKTIKLMGGGLAGAPSLSVNNGMITLNVPDGSGDHKAYLTPKVLVGESNEEYTGTLSGSGQQAVFSIDLPVYTMDEVDSLITSSLQDFEGMYFAGTIGTNGTATSLANLKTLTDVKSGATFKFITATTDTASLPIDGWDTLGNNQGAQVGDLLIITGTEGTNGYLDLTANTTKFTYVPSGDDVDIYYQPNFGTNKTLQFTRTGGTGSAAIYKAIFANGTDIDVSATNTNTTGGGTDQTITISHAAITTTPSTDTAIVAGTNGVAGTDYTAITGLTVNNGHVTGYKTQKITINHAKLASVKTSVSLDSTNNIALFGSDYVETGNGNTLNASEADTSKNNKFGLSSDTLNFSVTAAGAINSGSTTAAAANLKIDMVWGSF